MKANHGGWRYEHEPLTTFGRNLRRERKKHGWTQAELARRSGLLRDQVSSLETGRHGGTQGPQRRTVLRLAAALGCDEYDLTLEPLRWKRRGAILVAVIGDAL